jgi:2-(1,2-epoxy-1,2-dihydrophenyl)acetyl-CoA isomerase
MPNDGSQSSGATTPATADATAPAGVRVERPADGVLAVVLDRPGKLNAIDAPMARALHAALAAAARDTTVRVVVLRGAGRAFCAGRDVSEAPTPEILALVQDVARALVALPQPVVTAVHGWVVGAGLEWMLATDLVVATRGARFRLPEIEIGVFVTGGLLRTLPAVAGLARARGLMLLGEPFTAADAERWGLLWAVVDDAALDAEVGRIAARLAGFDPAVARRYKRALHEIGLDRYERALDLEARMQGEIEALKPGGGPG